MSQDENPFREHEPDEVVGSASLLSGGREPITAKQAAELWDSIEREKEARAVAMPTARDALKALCEANTRLKELGWRTGVWRLPSRGFAVCQFGSTGMWSGCYDGTYIHVSGCVHKPDSTQYWKPESALTEDEIAMRDEGDAVSRQLTKTALAIFRGDLPND